MKNAKHQTKKNSSKAEAAVVAAYDAAIDAKKRISLRGAKEKYFHVVARSDGSYLLEPRVLVPPGAVSDRTLKMLAKSAANLKKGLASPPIHLPDLAED